MRQSAVKLPPLAALHPGRLFFGWWLVLACLILSTLFGGFFFQGISAFIIPLEREFGTSRGTISLAIAMGSVAGIVVQPLHGILTDRIGPRKVMMASVILMGGGFMAITRANSLPAFFALFIFVLSVGATGVIFPAAMTVGNWFIRRRGIALALAVSGFGLGGIVVSLTNFFIEEWGWRTAAGIIGVIILSVGLPLGALMRHRPEQYGLLPDGVRRPEELDPATDAPAPSQEIDFTVREALRTRAFWMIALSQSLRMLVALAVGAHFIPAMIDVGLTSAQGAALFGLFGIVTLPSRLVFGMLADRFSKRLLGCGLFALMAGSLLLFAAGGGLALATAFAVLYAIAWGGGGGSLELSMRAEYFGRRHFATISGLGASLGAGGVIIGPALAGFTFDSTGSYQLAFLTFAGVAAMGSASMFLAKRPVPKRLVEE